LWESALPCGIPVDFRLTVLFPRDTGWTRRLLAFAVATAMFASSCAQVTTTARCRSGEQAAIMESLYFGTAMPAGYVTQAQWQQFLANVITPRFPDGLTAWAAAGQWRNPSGELQKEDSYVLHVVHPEDRRFETAVREVIDEYKLRFDQEAVLRVRTATCISF
jgi:hypothetical protein